MGAVARVTRRCTGFRIAVVVCVWLMTSTSGRGQDGQPPAGYPAVLRDVQLAFPTQDGVSIRPVEPYLKLIGLPKTSALHEGPVWTFYSRVEPLVLDGAQRLWASGRFHSVWVDVFDQPFENGALGRTVIFNVVERAEPGPPPAGLPTPPPGFERPPPSHERVYPPNPRS